MVWFLGWAAESKRKKLEKSSNPWNNLRWSNGRSFTPLTFQRLWNTLYESKRHVPFLTTRERNKTRIIHWISIPFRLSRVTILDSRSPFTQTFDFLFRSRCHVHWGKKRSSLRWRLSRRPPLTRINPFNWDRTKGTRETDSDRFFRAEDAWDALEDLGSCVHVPETGKIVEHSI